MRKENIKTVGGLLVSMEVNNENLMTRGLQESISFFSCLSLPLFSQSTPPLFSPFLADTLFSFKIPPAFLYRELISGMICITKDFFILKIPHGVDAGKSLTM